MKKENLELVDVKFIDMRFVQIWEGKFIDNEQDGEIYLYANICNLETSSFKESEVRVYPYSYDDLYNPDDYEIRVNSDIEQFMKDEILKRANIKKDPVLCGFVWCHGNKDFSAYEVNISKEDHETIEAILSKYLDDGTSERNCWDSKFSDVFMEEY